MILGIYPTENFSIVDALIVSLIAIVIVFLILILIIVIAGLFSKGMDKVDASTKILPREENKLLEEDEDAVAAALVATIDFYKETKQDARLVSIEKIDEE